MSKGLLATQDWEQLAFQAEFKPSRMACLCALSERQMQRIFNFWSVFGNGWSIRPLAKDLILKGYSSKAVAAELKFANESHFCREFKKRFGNPPTHFSPNRHHSLRLVKDSPDTKRQPPSEPSQSTAA
jgi:AraC-like DNA-binding protein